MLCAGRTGLDQNNAKILADFFHLPAERVLSTVNSKSRCLPFSSSVTLFLFLFTRFEESNFFYHFCSVCCFLMQENHSALRNEQNQSSFYSQSVLLKPSKKMHGSSQKQFLLLVFCVLPSLLFSKQICTNIAGCRSKSLSLFLITSSSCINFMSVPFEMHYLQI